MRVSVLHLALLGVALAVPLSRLDGSTEPAESTEIIARSPMVVAARNAILVPADDGSLSVREADDNEDGELAKRSPSPEPKKKKKNKKTNKKKSKDKKKAKAAKKKQENQEMDNMTPEELEAEIEKLKAELPTAKGKKKKQMKSKIKKLEKKLSKKGGKSNQDVLDQPGDPEGGFDGGLFDEPGAGGEEPAGDPSDPAADEPVQRRDT